MGYCEKHLNREKGSRAGEVGMILVGVVLLLLGGLILSAMVYAILTIHEIVLTGFLIGAIIAVSGVALIVYAAKRRNNRHALDANVEGSGLVKTIRRQLPPEQAGLSAQALFDLVDRDMEGGKSLGRVDIGRSWALIDKTALRMENMLGIFLYKETQFRGGIMSTHYELWVFDDGYRGTNLVFMQAGQAQACYDALTAAAPRAACGGKEEEQAFLKEARERQRAGAL